MEGGASQLSALLIVPKHCPCRSYPRGNVLRVRGDETQTLDLAAGVPLLAYVRTCYTKDRPVRLTETIFAGDRNRLVYELGDLDALYERDQ